MNLEALEKLVRRMMKGESVAYVINCMRKNGAISAAEYASFNGLALCVASNDQTAGLPARNSRTERMW